MMNTLIEGAKIACSTGSQAVLGVTPENAAEVPGSRRLGVERSSGSGRNERSRRRCISF